MCNAESIHSSFTMHLQDEAESWESGFSDDGSLEQVNLIATLSMFLHE